MRGLMLITIWSAGSLALADSQQTADKVLLGPYYLTEYSQ
jgi:hypothetical protein